MSLIREFAPEFDNYLRDESRSTGFAETISFPRTEAEVVEIVKACYAKGEAITTQGARTGLAAACVPKGGHILNLSRLNKITGLRYDSAAETYYLQAEPGVLLSQVRKALENKAFDIADWSAESIEALKGLKAGEWFFSPDPTEPTASIGGMASCNASGARSFLYGATRYHINALRIVLADGRLAYLQRGRHRADGRKFSLPLLDNGVIQGQLPDFDTPSTKDAGFYFHADMDLVDLFMGSQGSLGVITGLELALLKAPKLMWGMTAFVPDNAAALKYVRALRGETLAGVPVFKHRPASIEFFDHNAIQMFLSQKKITPAFSQVQEIDPNFTTAVYAEFNSPDPDSFYPVLNELAGVLEAIGGDPANTWVANNAIQMERLLFFRHAVSESVNMVIDQNRKNEPTLTMLGTDMAVPDSQLEAVFQVYVEALQKTDLHWVIFGHVGENHFHVNILPRSRQEYEAGYELYKKFGAEVAKMGGTISAEHGVGKLKASLMPIMYSEAQLDAMRELKRSLDPKHILCPGNIL